VPLSTLGAGKRWRARIWQDGADMNHLKTSTTHVQSRDRIQLTLAPSGGATIVLEPVGS